MVRPINLPIFTHKYVRIRGHPLLHKFWKSQSPFRKNIPPFGYNQIDDTQPP